MNRFKSALLPLGVLGTASTVGFVAISCGTSLVTDQADSRTPPAPSEVLSRVRKTCTASA